MDICIGIDASNLRRGGGITHLIELLNAAKPESQGISRIIVWGGSETLAQLPLQPWLKLVHEPMLDKSLPVRLYWQQIILPKLARNSCDVLFAPGGMGSISFRPFVTMFRNMIPFDAVTIKGFGRFLPRLHWRLVRWGQSRSFRQADGLIFLNEFAHSIVLKYLQRDSHASVIIPHGINPRFRIAPRPQKEIKQYSMSAPLRLLYVSIVYSYKHHLQVVQGISKLRKKGIPIVLDLIGGIGDKATYNLLQKTIEIEDPDGRWCNSHGDIPFGELHGFYQQADLFVYASSCENLPNILLEAMAAGLPIACSNRGPMPEVLGNAGVYFDPENPVEIAAAVESLLANPTLREKYAEAASARAAEHSWDKCADQTFAFLAKIASQANSL